MKRKVRKPKQTEPPGSPHARSREDMRWQGWRVPVVRRDDDAPTLRAQQEADATRLKWHGVIGRNAARDERGKLPATAEQRKRMAQYGPVPPSLTRADYHRWLQAGGAL